MTQHHDNTNYNPLTNFRHVLFDYSRPIFFFYDEKSKNERHSFALAVVIQSQFNKCSKITPWTAQAIFSFLQQSTRVSKINGRVINEKKTLSALLVYRMIKKVGGALPVYFQKINLNFRGLLGK